MTEKQRFEHLLAVTSSKKFLENKAYAQEIPFFICPYLATDANKMNKLISNLVKKLKEKQITVLHLNLYDTCLEILDEKRVLTWIINNEESKPKDKIKELLQNSLDIEKYVIPHIRKFTDKADYDLIFVSGMGEVYPYIRAHNFLNNLQSTIKSKPMLMFFPGDYTHSLEKGSVLELFGKLTDDRYYRAFDIFDIKVESL